MPALRTTSINRVGLAVDTSASVNRDELEQFSGELNAILASVRPNVVDFFEVDTRIAGHTELTPEDYPLEVRYRGRGGTEFYPVFNHYKEAFEQPDCLIYLSDGECGYGGIEEPPFPVLWVFTSGYNEEYYGRPPFGTLIVFDE